MEDKIVIRGAKENNLKNVDLVIPRNKFIVSLVKKEKMEKILI